MESLKGKISVGHLVVLMVKMLVGTRDSLLAGSWADERVLCWVVGSVDKRDISLAAYLVLRRVVKMVSSLAAPKAATMVLKKVGAKADRMVLQ